MNKYSMSWEQAVEWLRNQPDQSDLVRACFFDDPLMGAAKRFHGCDEWKAVQQLLPANRGKALDLGAGRGIAAYALSADGWETIALEPDASELVGAGAIRQLAHQTGYKITVVEEWGERLPFDDAAFDLVHARQVLHHAHHLGNLVTEVARVLKPGGVLVATREHVISRSADLQAFLDAHPLHALYGGEHAYTLDQYLGAIREAGLTITRVLNPWASPINLFPSTMDEIRCIVSARYHFPFPKLIPDFVMRWIGGMINNPGRLYSFTAVKVK